MIGPPNRNDDVLVAQIASAVSVMGIGEFDV
jgi:hypothetical protein